MGEVVQVFKGEASGVVHALAEIEASERKVRDAAKEAHKASEEGMQGLAKGAADAGRELAERLIPGISGVHNAATAMALGLGTAFEAVGEIFKKMAEQGREYKKELDELLAAGIKASKVSLLPDLEKAVQGIRATHVPPEERNRILGGVFGELGQRLSGPQLLEAATFGIKSENLGLKPEDASAGAQVMGTLRAAFPGADSGEIEKAATVLRNQRISDQENRILMSWAAGGRGIEDAASSIWASRTTGAGGRLAMAFGGMTGRDVEQLQRPGHMIAAPEAAAALEAARAQRSALEVQRDAAREAVSALPHWQRHAQETEVHRLEAQIRAAGEEITGLERQKIEDPAARARREAELAINLLPEDQQLLAAYSHPELLPPRMRDLAKAFVQQKGQYPAAVAQAMATAAEVRQLRETEPGFKAAAEAQARTTAAAKYAYDVAHDPGKIEFAGDVDAARKVLDAHGLGAGGWNVPAIYGGAAGLWAQRRIGQVREEDADWNRTHLGFANLFGPGKPAPVQVEIIKDHTAAPQMIGPARNGAFNNNDGWLPE